MRRCSRSVRWLRHSRTGQPPSHGRARRGSSLPALPEVKRRIRQFLIWRLVMLELVCYLLALVFGLLAVVGPPHPQLDRVRLLAAAFSVFVVPMLVHAAERV